MAAFVAKQMVGNKLSAVKDEKKQSVRLAVKNFPIEKVRPAIYDWPYRVKECIATNGDHVE